MSTVTDEGILGNSEVHDVKELDSVTILFAGDSGDGMQVTGSQFTDNSVVFGNDISTFPDFPAEIRAPAGTLEGVSAYQLHFSNHDIRTPGDHLNALVAMNAAALKKYLKELEKGGILIVDKAGFGANELKKVDYAANPLEDGSLHGYRVVPIDITPQTIAAVKPAGVSGRNAERCKNFYTLGVAYYLYDRAVEPTIEEHQEALLQERARHRRSQCAGHPGRLQPGPHHRALQDHLPGAPGPVRAGLVPQHQRQRRHGAGHRRRRQQERQTRVLRLLPHHPGLGHPARAQPS